MGLDRADDDVDAGLPPRVRALKHLVGFTDAGSGADEDLEAASLTVLAPRRFQQGFRRGALFGIAALLLGHPGNIVLRPRPA